MGKETKATIVGNKSNIARDKSNIESGRYNIERDKNNMVGSNERQRRETQI